MAGGPRRLGPLVGIEAATLLSGTGNGAALVILPWIALDLTGRAGDAGVVASATALPLLVSSLLAGSIVDRVGRRRTSIVSDVASAASFAAIPIAGEVVGLSIGILVVLAAGGAVFDPAGVTARETMLPAAARVANRRLDDVNGVHEAIWGVAFLAGPGLGGLLIAAFGAVAAVWVVTGTFLASAVAIAVVELDEPPDDERADESSTWATIVEGFRIVAGDRLLRFLAITNTLLAAIYLPAEGVLLPAWFESVDQPGRLGLVLAVTSAGGIVGALASSWWNRLVGRARSYRVSLLASAAAIGGMAVTLDVLVALALCSFLLGVAYGPVQPSINLAIQTRSDEHRRGRVTGVLLATDYAGGPVGFVVVGLAADAFGVRTTFAICAVALGAVAVLAAAATASSHLDELDGT